LENPPLPTKKQRFFDFPPFSNLKRNKNTPPLNGWTHPPPFFPPPRKNRFDFFFSHVGQSTTSVIFPPSIFFPPPLFLPRRLRCLLFPFFSVRTLILRAKKFWLFSFFFPWELHVVLKFLFSPASQGGARKNMPFCMFLQRL